MYKVPNIEQKHKQYIDNINADNTINNSDFITKNHYFTYAKFLILDSY